jgi:hypothetical protein
MATAPVPRQTHTRSRTTPVSPGKRAVRGRASSERSSKWTVWCAPVAPACGSSPLLQIHRSSTASRAIGKASAAKRRILSSPALRRVSTPAPRNNAQCRRQVIRMSARHPSGRGVPVPLRNFDRQTEDSGQAANCRAFCRSETDSRLAIRCLPRALLQFPSFPLRFPLVSRIETPIRRRDSLRWRKTHRYKNCHAGKLQLGQDGHPPLN